MIVINGIIIIIIMISKYNITTTTTTTTATVTTSTTTPMSLIIISWPIVIYNSLSLFEFVNYGDIWKTRTPISEIG